MKRFIVIVCMLLTIVSGILSNPIVVQAAGSGGTLTVGNTQGSDYANWSYSFKWGWLVVMKETSDLKYSSNLVDYRDNHDKPGWKPASNKIMGLQPNGTYRKMESWEYANETYRDYYDFLTLPNSDKGYNGQDPAVLIELGYRNDRAFTRNTYHGYYIANTQPVGQFHDVVRAYTNCRDEAGSVKLKSSGYLTAELTKVVDKEAKEEGNKPLITWKNYCTVYQASEAKLKQGKDDFRAMFDDYGNVDDNVYNFVLKNGTYSSNSPEAFVRYLDLLSIINYMAGGQYNSLIKTYLATNNNDIAPKGSSGSHISVFVIPVQSALNEKGDIVWANSSSQYSFAYQKDISKLGSNDGMYDSYPELNKPQAGKTLEDIFIAKNYRDKLAKKWTDTMVSKLSGKKMQNDFLLNSKYYWSHYEPTPGASGAVKAGTYKAFDKWLRFSSAVLNADGLVYASNESYLNCI